MTEPPNLVTEALRRRIQAGLHYGTLKSGERLSSLRQVATEFHTNPRAVMGSYRQLADEGLVCVRPRSGVFVQAPRRTEPSPPDVVEWVVELFLRGLARDLAPTDLRRQMGACLDGGAPARIACLECNHDQIYALCQQVHRDYGFAPVAIDTATLAGRRSVPPSVRGVDLVLTTRFHGEEAERLGKRLRRPVLVATLDPFFVTEVRRLHASGTVWWLCTDDRFAAKLPRIFPGVSVKPIVLGRHPPDDIPPGDIVYATRRAADRLPPRWRGGKVVTISRVLSAQTARALLLFLVERNLRQARLSKSRRRLRARSGPRVRPSRARRP